MLCTWMIDFKKDDVKATPELCGRVSHRLWSAIAGNDIEEVKELILHILHSHICTAHITHHREVQFSWGFGLLASTPLASGRVMWLVGVGMAVCNKYSSPLVAILLCNHMQGSMACDCVSICDVWPGNSGNDACTIMQVARRAGCAKGASAAGPRG